MVRSGLYLRLMEPLRGEVALSVPVFMVRRYLALKLALYNVALLFSFLMALPDRLVSSNISFYLLNGWIDSRPIVSFYKAVSGEIDVALMSPVRDDDKSSLESND